MWFVGYNPIILIPKKKLKFGIEIAKDEMYKRRLLQSKK